jgi:hypothetical protein
LDARKSVEPLPVSLPQDSLPVAVADCARAAVLFNHIPVLHALVAEYALNINGIKPETRVDWAGLQPRVLSGPRDMQPLHHLVFLACYSTDPCNVLQFLIQSGVDVNKVSVNVFSTAIVVMFGRLHCIVDGLGFARTISSIYCNPLWSAFSPAHPVGCWLCHFRCRLTPQGLPSISSSSHGTAASTSLF